MSMRNRLINAVILGIMILFMVACGPSKRNRTYLRAFPVIGQLMNESVSTFCRDGDYMWIGYGYMGAGVTKYNIRTGWAKHFTNLHEANGITYSMGGITGIAVTDKHVWLVGGEEVVCMDKKDRVVKRFTDRNGLPSHKAFSIATTKMGVLVGYMGYGFSIINDETLEIENHKLLIDSSKYDDYENRYSPTSFVYSEGVLYMGTMEGVVLVLQRSISTIRIIRVSTESSDVEISHVSEEIWISEWRGLNSGRLFLLKNDRAVRMKKLDCSFALGDGTIDGTIGLGDCIYFATSDRYIYSWNRETDQLKRIRLRNGLFGYYSLEAFYFDGEYFWIGFQNGAQVIPKKVLLKMIEDDGKTPIINAKRRSKPGAYSDEP